MENKNREGKWRYFDSMGWSVSKGKKNLTPTQHKLNPRMCTVRQSLTRLKIPQSHKSKIKAGGSTQVARGNLSFKFLIDTSKQSEQFQGVPSFSGGQIGGRNINDYNLI